MRSTTEQQEGASNKGRAAERASIIREMIERIEKKLGTPEMKVTISDLIRLLQIEKEMDQGQQARDIKVTWVDPSEIARFEE